MNHNRHLSHYSTQISVNRSAHLEKYEIITAKVVFGCPKLINPHILLFNIRIRIRGYGVKNSAHISHGVSTTSTIYKFN